jgi:hypothetical protein
LQDVHYEDFTYHDPSFSNPNLSLNPMSFTPDRPSSQAIKPFKILQASVSQMPPMYLPLIILATPTLVLSILGVTFPSLEIPLTIVDAFVLTPIFSGASIYLVDRYAIMIDDLDAVAAIKFSWNLVGDRWGKVFIAQLLSVLCFVVPVLGILAVIGVFLKSNGLPLELIFNLIFGAAGLIVTPLLTLYYTKLYLRLKAPNNENQTQ